MTGVSYENIEFKKARRWVCELYVRFPTQRQCTKETHLVKGGGYNWLPNPLEVLSAYLSARYNLFKHRRRLQAIDGNFDLA
jgi:hypothetical protein